MKPRHGSRPPLRATPIGSKATTPSTESRLRVSAAGGAASSARKHNPTPAERWAEAVPGVLDRFRAEMAVRYADENSDCDPPASTLSHSSDQIDHPVTPGGSHDA